MLYSSIRGSHYITAGKINCNSVVPPGFQYYAMPDKPMEVYVAGVTGWFWVGRTQMFSFRKVRSLLLFKKKKVLCFRLWNKLQIHGSDFTWKTAMAYMNCYIFVQLCILFFFLFMYVHLYMSKHKHTSIWILPTYFKLLI